eukprot:46918_1
MHDQNEDQVKLIEKYPTDRQYTGVYCYDSNTNKLFIICIYSDGVGIYDMKTKHWDFKDNRPFTNNGASCVLLNDQIHVVGGYNNGHHLIYNVKKNEWTKSIAITVESGLQHCAINKCSK